MSARTANSAKSSSVKSATSSGTKRKRGNEPKFYAVKVGMKPGIYSTWPDCFQQINGYKHALCTLCSIFFDLFILGSLHGVWGKLIQRFSQGVYRPRRRGSVSGIWGFWHSKKVGCSAAEILCGAEWASSWCIHGLVVGTEANHWLDQAQIQRVPNAG